MNADKLQRLEKNKKFRKKFYNKEVWKNYAIIPPSVILFASLFGVLFLFNTDRLFSLYVIPCIILLLLGTIWLKAVRKYIITQKISDDRPFLICSCIPLMEKNKKTIMMFSSGYNRHNKNYLEKKRKEILERISGGDDSLDLTSNSGVKLIPDSDVYIVIPSFSDRIANKKGNVSVNRYVIFNNENRIKYITARELESFS